MEAAGIEMRLCVPTPPSSWQRSLGKHGELADTNHDANIISQFANQAARCSLTSGKCACPDQRSTSMVKRAPGLPATSACGGAHGDPRGHLSLGSSRGWRWAATLFPVVIPTSKLSSHRFLDN